MVEGVRRSVFWEGHPPACPTFQPRSGVGARLGGGGAVWLLRDTILGQAGGCPSQGRWRAAKRILGGASSGMPHFSAAKRRWRAAWWGRGGVVASGYNLGTSRRLSLPWSKACGGAYFGRGILRHALLFSREAALARGLVGAGRCGCYGIQSWDKPEVVPPKVDGVRRSVFWEGHPPACPTFQPRSGVGARCGGDAAVWLLRYTI